MVDGKSGQTTDYHESRRDELDAELKRINAQNVPAGVVAILGGALSINNHFGGLGPDNHFLTGLLFFTFIAGILWLWGIRRQTNRVIQLSVENNRQMDRSRDL
tara:strand:- start:140 stop:448 length:309 start_codon:yes stop_codon:yes gene_type:complete